LSFLDFLELYILAHFTFIIDSARNLVPNGGEPAWCHCCARAVCAVAAAAMSSRTAAAKPGGGGDASSAATNGAAGSPSVPAAAGDAQRDNVPRRMSPNATAEELKADWNERRKKFHHDRTPPPDEFKDKLFAIVAGAEHCVPVAHEVAYVLETCCGYHHSRVFRLIGPDFTRGNLISRLQWCATALPADAKLLVYIGTRLVNPGGMQMRTSPITLRGPGPPAPAV
jgi:hypothetical protein